MATQRRQVEEIRAFGGQKSGRPPRSLNPQDSELIYNFSNIDGILEKINGGAAYLTSALGSSPIRWLGRYKNKWMWQVADKLGIEAAEDSATESTVTTDFTSERAFSDKWRDNIFLANTKKFSFYDGTTFKDVGLLPIGEGKAPRPLAPTFTTGTSGSIPAGTHAITFTLYDSTTQTESLPWGALPGQFGLLNTAQFNADTNPLGWLSSNITFPANGIAIITDVKNTLFANGYPSRADKIRIYRSKTGDLTTFYLDSEYNVDKVFSASPDLSISKSDADLGEILITEERQPPPQRSALINSGAASSATGIRHLRQWRDSLLAVGVEIDRYTISDSVWGGSDTVLQSDSLLYASDAFQYDYWPFNFEIGRGDGQKLRAVAVIVDIPLIFKDASTYMLVGDNVTNAIPRRIDSRRGCVHESTLQETPLGAICLSGEGFILARPAVPTDVISKDIQDVIDDINFDKLDNADSAYDRVDGLYYCMLPTGGATYPNKTVVFDVKTGQWSTHREREGTAIHFDIGSDSKPRALIGASSGGQLVNLIGETNVTHLGSQITARWRSGQFALGDPSVRKKAKWLYVLAEANEAWTIDIRIFSDLYRGTVYEATSISSQSNYAVYGTDLYGTGRYVGEKVRELVKIPIEGVGRLFQVEVVHNSTQAKQWGFRVLSVQLEGVVMGR